MITFNQLAQFLPPGSFEFIGNNQVKVNFSQITGDSINLDSSCIKGLVKLFKGLVTLTNDINFQREHANPPLPSIELASEQLIGVSDHPRIQLIMEVEVNTESFVNNLVDVA